MTLPYDRPTILDPPEHPPVCCSQQTITVPPHVNAKTAQKHDYPSPAHRTSYNRRTAAERTFATITDPATTNIARGWCRLMGLTPIALFTATVADRPQPPCRRRVQRPPSRERAPRRQRTPTQTPQTPPANSRRSHQRRKRAALKAQRDASDDNQPASAASRRFSPRQNRPAADRNDHPAQPTPPRGAPPPPTRPPRRPSVHPKREHTTRANEGVPVNCVGGLCQV